jgi:hypothetical protein
MGWRYNVSAGRALARNSLTPTPPLFPGRVCAIIPINKEHLFAFKCMRVGVFHGQKLPLLDIVDRKINALARNAKGLRGIQRDGTGSNWL